MAIMMVMDQSELEKQIYKEMDRMSVYACVFNFV